MPLPYVLHQKVVSEIASRPARQSLDQLEENRRAKIAALIPPQDRECHGANYKTIMRQTFLADAAAKGFLEISIAVLSQHRPYPLGGSRRGGVEGGQFGECIEYEFDKFVLLHICTDAPVYGGSVSRLGLISLLKCNENVSILRWAALIAATGSILATGSTMESLGLVLSRRW